MPVSRARSAAPSSRPERGAYGLRLTGVPRSPMLLAAAPDWPALHVVCELGDPVVPEERLTGTHAVLRLKTGGRLTLDRATGVARYTVPRRLTPAELTHPMLAPAAAVAAHWAGRLSFHAGAFVTDGGVWAVVGAREAGKSSTLAWLALHGHDVVADDVLVLDNDKALAAPRSIDLRQETADRFGVGMALGVIGTRPRWRVTLPAVPAELPFRGWIFLEWGDRIGIRRSSGAESLRRLLDALTVRTDASDPGSLLELATLPAWAVERPRDWALLDDAMHALLDLTR